MLVNLGQSWFGRSLFLALALRIFLPANSGAVDVLTHHNNIARTGANLEETILTVSNVNSVQFGKLFTRAVVGQIYAQPLYVQGLTISNKIRNVLYVCTEHNNVYAFDADDSAATAALWQVNLGAPVPAFLYTCADLTPEIGITSTPVIDRNSGTIYLTAKSQEVAGSVTNYFYRLHAMDLLTGQEKFGGPVVIQGSVPGKGAGSSGGIVSFTALKHLNRPGLLLFSNVVYLGFASHCDNTPYHGWVLGYDATTLQQKYIFNTTPNGSDGGIWSCGMGLSADTNGNIYAMTGNGTFSAWTNGPDYSDCFIKLSVTNGNLAVADWFAPHDQANLNSTDHDLGSGGPMPIPGTQLLVGLSKNGVMYLMDRNHLGGYVNDLTATTDTNIVQEFSPGVYTCCVAASPLYWDGPTNQFLYLYSGSIPLKAFNFTGSLFMTTPLATGGTTQPFKGGGTSISASSNLATSAIIWGIDPGNNGTLRAYAATNVSRELWNSQQNAARDTLTGFSKFCPPTIANGKVYVATFTNKLVVYGLFAPPDFSLAVTPAAQTVSAGNNATYTVTITSSNGFNGDVALSASGLLPGIGASFNPASIVGGGTSTLTLSTSNLTALANYPLTITGISGGLAHTATSALSVNGMVAITDSFNGASNLVSLTFNTVSGQTYRVDYSDVLPPAWNPLGAAQIATNSSLTVPDIITTQAQRFYRATLLP